jgi:hypothetical protein
MTCPIKPHEHSARSVGLPQNGARLSAKAVAAVKDQLYILDEDTHVYRVDPIAGEIADRMRTRLRLYSFEHNGDLYRYGVG